MSLCEFLFHLSRKFFLMGKQQCCVCVTGAEFLMRMFRLADEAVDRSTRGNSSVYSSDISERMYLAYGVLSFYSNSVEYTVIEFEPFKVPQVYLKFQPSAIL